MNIHIKKSLKIITMLLLLAFCLTLLSSCGDDEYENSLTKSDESRKYKAGETAHYKRCEITIDNPEKVVNVDPEDVKEMSEHAYFKVPIHIECKKSSVLIGSKDFNGIKTSIEDALPYKDFEIDKGASYDGYIYIHYSAKKIEYDGYSGEGVWTFNKKHRKKLIKDYKSNKTKSIKELQSKVVNCSSIDQIASCENKSIVKAKVYYLGEERPHIDAYAGYNNVICVAFDKDGVDDFYVSLKKDEWGKREKYKENDTIVVKGELAVKGYDGEYSFQTLPLLKNGSIIE